MWKASVSTVEEALLILNCDIYHHQKFSVNRICDLMQSGGPCRDVSPEYRLDYLPEPFSYDLRPGQGMVLVAERSD
jgi:starch synthase (maltosyl-transferring)